MKVDLELISTALDSVLEQNKVDSDGAIPLKALMDHWEAIRLRSSDLSSGIDVLHARGRIELERRRDGVWVRRTGKHTIAPGAYERLLESFRGVVTGLALHQLRQRRGDGYSGMDRRIAPRGTSRASAKSMRDNTERA